MNSVFRLSVIVVVGLFVLTGAVLVAYSEDGFSSLDVIAGGELVAGGDGDSVKGTLSEHGAKIALGNNANAVLSLDLIADGGAGNQRDDGVTTGAVQGRGTIIAIEVFATGVTTSLRGAIIRFDFDASLVTYVKSEKSAFDLSIPEGSVGVNLASTSPVTLASSGFLVRAEFETAADVTGREFTIGVEKVSIAESSTSSDELTTGSVITFNAAGSGSPDFDGDGTVGFPDFLAFAGGFGASRGDARYEARFDLDGDGSVAFSDFLVFAGAFGSEVPPSGGGGTPAGSAPADQNAFDRLAVGKRILAESYFLDIVSAGRFAEGFGRREGRYTYTNTGPMTGNLTQIYDDSELFGGKCTLEMTFTTEATGTIGYTCDDGTSGDAEAWRANDLSTPVFTRATPDTLYFRFLDTWRAGETRAYDLELRTKAPQGEWEAFCTTFTNRGNNVFIGYATTWFYGALKSNTTYEMRYRYRNSSSCETGSADPWSPIAEGTTAPSGTGGGGGGGGTTPPSGDYKPLDGLRVSSGRVQYLFFSAGNCIILNNSTVNGVSYMAHTSKWQRKQGSAWVDVPGTERNGLCSYSPTVAGEYRLVAEITINGVRGKYASENTLTVSGTGGGGSDNPDLIVESPSVDDNTLTTGQSFTLSATVRNQGNGAAGSTTLRYYRSSNSTISTNDTEVGTDAVSGLSPGGTSAESISLNAPSDAGTYYYGACVDDVSDESDTGNNCSDAVEVTVSGSGGGSGGACRAGLVVNPGGTCTYKGNTFSVSSSGRGSIAFFSAGTGIDARGSTINGVRWNFHATKNSGSNSWTIHVAD
ncbi:MAG: hypothetical protein OXU79_17525 [Gemmatimonadota bacterium]|nr:hypothetical protein [Gemmatimonadota bacterium]